MARLSPSLGNAGFLLFCLWVSGCRALWRYKTNTGDYFIFSTRTTIHLEYEGTTFQSWDTGSFCTAANPSLPQTTMHCTVAGTHRIFPQVPNPTFEDNPRHLSVISDADCFMWYIHQERRMVQDQHFETQSITAWIFDPENAHPTELDHVAVSPPVYSKMLTKHFWNLGERPSIVTVVEKQSYRGKARQEGSWTIIVPTISDDIIAHIMGNDITFMDCFVLDTPIIIAQLTTNLNFQQPASFVSLPPGSDSKVIWSACIPTVAVLATDNGVFFTTDGFLTSIAIQIPDDLLLNVPRDQISDLAIDNRDTLILIDSLVFVVTDNDVYTIDDFPSTGIIGIQGRTLCASEYPIDQYPISDVLVWTEEEVYRGFPGDLYEMLEDTLTLKQHFKLDDSVDLTILNVAYDSLPSRIIMLLQCVGCTPTTVLYLASYDEETEQWSLRDFSWSPPVIRTIHLEILFSTKTTMVLWDEDTVYYSYQATDIHGYLEIAGVNQIFSAANHTSTIHQIVVDAYGNAIIKLRDNHYIFFFKFGMTEVVRLPVWISNTADCMFYANPSGDLYMLTIVGTQITRHTYPMRLEVFSVTQEACPYISFQHNIEYRSYYLDKGQNITFWCQIVFLEDLGLSTDILIHNPRLLKQKEVVQYEIARGICTKNLTVTFYHDLDYSDVYNYTRAMIRSSGVMSVQMQPSTTGRTCTSKNRLTHIRVGCNPEKYVQVDGAKSSVCKKFNYTIPQKYLMEPAGDKDLQLEFNKEYGCPIDVHYSVPFRPSLGIYMKKIRIGTVESNYILWEVNGRKDFSFNTTMKEAGCLYVAQNWSTMIYKEHNTTFKKAIALDDDDFMKLWGPHNYKSCFITRHIDQSHLEAEYVILNNSGINFIIWPQYHTGIYLFRLRIVDPNFSFCDPYVRFSVRTFGIIKRTSFLKIAGWSVLIVTLFSGVLLCSYFRYMRTFRTLRYVDPLQSFRQDVSPTESAEDDE